MSNDWVDYPSLEAFEFELCYCQLRFRLPDGSIRECGWEDRHSYCDATLIAVRRHPSQIPSTVKHVIRDNHGAYWNSTTNDFGPRREATEYTLQELPDMVLDLSKDIFSVNHPVDIRYYLGNSWEPRAVVVDCMD